MHHPHSDYLKMGWLDVRSECQHDKCVLFVWMIIIFNQLFTQSLGLLFLFLILIES